MIIRKIAQFAIMLCALSLALGSAANSIQQSGPLGMEDQITLAVSVTNKNDQPIRDLPKSAFQVLDAGLVQTITAFDDQNGSASVALVLDPSTIDAAEYRDNKRIPRLIDAMANFVASSNAGNHYFLIRAKEPGGDSADYYSAAEALAVLKRSDAASFQGNSSIYFAYYLAASKVSKGPFAKRAVVLITDGLDFSARKLEVDVESLVSEKSILVYVIFMTPEGSPEKDYNSGTTADIAFWFQSLAESTGGMFFHARSAKNVNTLLQRISADLRRRYTITFRPTKPLVQGKCFPFKVNVTSADTAVTKSLRVRTRRNTCANS